MSIEQFCESNPPESIASIFRREKDESDLKLLSRFLSQMKEAGRQGLILLTPKESGRIKGIDPEDVKRVMTKGKRGIGAIFIACAIDTFHGVLAYRQIDLEYLVSIIGESFIGTILRVPGIEEEYRKATEVLQDDWQKMVDEFKRDKTYAGFFRYPKLLPDPLRTFMADNGILAYALETLDYYEAAAKSLLSTP